MNLFGINFVLDGDLLDNLTIGDALTIDDRDVTLSGLLADGSPFSFGLESSRGFDGDIAFFSPGATLTVTLVSVPEPGSLALLG